MMLALYLSTGPKELSWALGGADGGEIAAAVFERGLIHSPGYPTYLAVAQLARLLPIEPFALRLISLSAVLTAFSTFGIGYLSWQLTNERSAPIGAMATTMLLWGLHTQVWTQAVIVEVYALAGACCVLLLILSTRLQTAPSKTGWVYWGIALGLGIGAHYIVALIGLFTLLLMIRQLRWKNAIGGILGLLGGLLIFVWLPLQTGNSIHNNWGAPNTLNQFWWVVSGAAYAGRFNVIVSPLRLISLVGLVVRELSVVGITLVVFGYLAWLEEKRNWAVAGLWVIGLNFWLVAGYDSADTLPYLYPSLLIFALAGGSGTIALAAQFIRYKTRYPAITNIIQIALLLILSISLLTRTLPTVVAADTMAETFGRNIVNAAPPNSVILSSTEEHTFSIRYAAAVEKRQDLILIDLDLIYFEWYLHDVLFQLNYAEETLYIPQLTHPLSVIMPLIPADTPIFSTTPDLPVPATLEFNPDNQSYRVSSPYD